MRPWPRTRPQQRQGEGQRLLPSAQLMCNIWWIVSQVSLQPSYLTSGIGPSDVDICTPIGSTPPDVLGRGVAKMCVGHDVDHDGLRHPIDLEIEDMYWVPQRPMNLLATPCIAEQNIGLYTGPRGNGLYMPGSQIRCSVGLACAPRRWAMMVILSLCSIWEWAGLS